MKLEVVKKGQGKRARMIGYSMGVALLVFGSISLYAAINVPNENVWVEGVPVIGEVTLYNVIALGVFLVGLLCLHLFLNRESFVDLLIETEQEMKKVSWPNRAEVQRSTIVVAVVTAVLSLSLFAFDWLLQGLFQLIIKS